MLVNVCWQLNRLRLGFLATLIRHIVFALLGATYDEYDAPTVGYKGYLTSPIGTVAFIDVEGNVTFSW